MFKSYFVFFPSFPTKKKLLNNRGKIRFPRFLWDVYKIDVASVSKTWYQWLGWMNASWGAFPCPTSILKELRLAQLYAETEQWLPWPLTRAGELASITDDTWMGWGNYKSLLAGDHRTVSTSPCFLFNYSEKKKACLCLDHRVPVSRGRPVSICLQVFGFWFFVCFPLKFPFTYLFKKQTLLWACVPECICVYQVHTGAHRRVRKGHWIYWNWITGGGEMSCRWGELNLEPLKEQPALLTTEPTPQPFTYLCLILLSVPCSPLSPSLKHGKSLL